jgi:triacylglycerol lipase
MVQPTPEQIQQSNTRLHQELPLLQQDIFNLGWEFTRAANQYTWLKEIYNYNQKLAESLLLFRKRLQFATTDQSIATVLDQLVLHYIINTNGPISELEDDDPFDAFDAAARYAESLCVRLQQDEQRDAILHINGKELRYAGLAAQGMSAAAQLRQVGPVINHARYGRKDIIPSVVFGFNPNRLDYRLKNAMVLADFSQLAYFEADFVEAHTRLWGYDTFIWVEDPETDTQVLVAGKDDFLIICFRGTSNGRDALVDLNFFKTDAVGGRGRVHRGFQQSLEGVWERLQAAVDELGADKKLFFTGHSLGGALGQLVAYRFALHGYKVAGVYVFGAPRVGNQEFKTAYNEQLLDQTYLHINDEDLVPQIPPQVLGFHDLGGLPRKFDKSYSISGPEILLEDDAIELDLDALDAMRQEAIQQTMNAVQSSISGSTRFLNTQVQQFSTLGQGADFKTSAVDDHSVHQYLYKFGCAILEAEWQKLEQQSLEGIR